MQFSNLSQADTARVVRAWQTAVNTQALETTLTLSDPQIEILGPRGVARGHEVLSQWLQNAGASFEIIELFVQGQHAVARQRGVWRDPQTQEIRSETEVASWFQVSQGKVSAVQRFESLEQALSAAGLNRNDLLP